MTIKIEQLDDDFREHLDLELRGIKGIVELVGDFDPPGDPRETLRSAMWAVERQIDRLLAATDDWWKERSGAESSTTI